MLYGYCRNTRGEMNLQCVAAGVANNIDIFGGIDANEKTTRKCSAVL